MKIPSLAQKRGLVLKTMLETAKELRAALDRAIAAAQFEEAWK